ncbi:MAG: GntR family transcriptional regulator, partial [Candidatus Hydrogenedentes bacterium]|nr:GntR family transcriptional regulator [Candidatus Hydrogenedentota bacterium]
AFETLPNRKVVVPYLSEEKLTELMYWRKILEGRAVTQAAKNMTPKLIKEIKSINADLVQAVEEDDFHLTLIKNQEFHFAIYRLSENTILLPMIESLWLQGGPSIYFSLVSPNIVWNGQHHEGEDDGIHVRGVHKFHDHDRVPPIKRRVL